MAAAKRHGKPGNGVRSIEDRIEQYYQRLPDSERRLADVILDFPGDIASYSATELAALAGVSKAAATRFFRRLGFASYSEARRQAREIQEWGSPLYLQSQQARTGGGDSRLEAHLQDNLRLLTRTFDNLRAEDLEKIVDAILGARRVWLLGFRNSYILAGYACAQLVLVRDDVHLLPVGGEALAEYLAGIGPDDLLLAVGVRRRLRRLQQAMQHAREAGARIVYLTDPSVGETARLADWTLRCEVRGASLFDSYVAAMSVLHLLCTVVAERAGEPGRARMKRVEKLHEKLAEFRR